MSALDIQSLSKTISARPAGPFHFSDVYGGDWEALYIGDKVKLGNAFQRAVQKGDLPEVEDTGRKDKSGHVYKRREA